MKNKISLVKKLLAFFLSLLISVGVTTPAFAMEEYDDAAIFSDEIDNLNYQSGINEIKGVLARLFRIYQSDRRMQFARMADQAKQMAELDEARKAAELAAESWTALAGNILNTAMSTVRNISAIISLVNGSVSLLKSLGVLEGEKDASESILEGIDSIKLSVDEIDRKTDKIQETLVSEFSELDLKLQEQEYNHYKDDVWAHFYTDAVIPLSSLQNEYNDEVKWLLVSYIEQWQGTDDCPTDLRALYGEDGNGGFSQVYSAKNIDDIGEKLPRTPRVSIDSIPVSYSITVPSEYISENFNEMTVISSENCVELLTDALEKGIYEAAENKELEAYGGFETEWSYLAESEKREMAKEIAADLADGLAFACAYNAANERKFASNVKSAYENFTKWLNGADSLTSPLYAQFKMLSLTHGFEGEISAEIETIIVYLMLMDMNFATFAETVVSFSKAHGENDCEVIKSMWTASEINLAKEASSFITGNPNFCYPINKVIEYRNVGVSSSVSFTYGQWSKEKTSGGVNNYTYHDIYSSTPWVIWESDAEYPPDRTAAAEKKNASNNEITEKMISTKEAKLIYAMYQTGGNEGTFSEYLAENNVTVSSDNTAEKLVTSISQSSLDLGKGVQMTAYLPTGMSEYITDGNSYAVSSGVTSKFSNSKYRVHDQVTGGLFNMQSGSFDENALLAAKVFYGEDNSFYMDEMVVFTTAPVSYTKRLLSYDEQPTFDQDEYYDFTADVTANYGVIVTSEIETYTFPEKTETISDGYFALNSSFDRIIFEGIPEKIAPNAFLGIGSPAERCLLVTPADFEISSLTNQWHGGWFGNTNITLHKNDGSNEVKATAAVLGDSAENVVNPFSAPVGAIFKGWSTSADAFEPEYNLSVVPGMELYAIWEADHKHDFEITGAKAATCTESGNSGEKVCKICGLKVSDEITAPCGHTCTFNKLTDGNYRIYCTDCGYVRVLYPETYGRFKVWSRDIPDGGIRYEETKTEGNKLVIDASGVYVIECVTTPAAQSIAVNSGVATIGLAGVDIAPSANISAINAAADATVHLTLLDGTENNIAGGWGTAAIDVSGKLVIDGSGSLTATAVNDPAIIVPESGAEIRSGCITAESEKSKGIGVRAGKEDNKVTVSANACVYSNGGIGGITVNENNENVYLAEIENKNNNEIIVDGNVLPFKSAPGKDSAYVYLDGKDHIIKVGEEEKEPVFNGSGFSYINEYGPFSVKISDTNAVKYENGVLRILDSVPVEISNIDSSVPTDSRIVVAGEINADVTLAGVNISTLRSENGGSPFEIEPGDGEVKVTLADGTANKLTAAIYKAALSKNGGSGTLTIDGNGSLEAVGGPYAAAIGSDFNNIVRAVRIDGGNIKATATYGGAGIGSGGSGTAALVTVETLPDGGTVAYSCSGITVNGGNITAESDYGAGIGCGNSSANSETVYAARDITINGGTVAASSEYMAAGIGAGKNCAAKNVRINGGIVTASTKSEDCGGIGSCVNFSGLVIGPTASVKATFDAEPVNAQGKSVYLNKIDVNGTSAVIIDGVRFPYTDHNGEKSLYVYLPETPEFEIKPLVKIGECENGTVIPSVSSAAAGERVTLNPVADEGYAFKSYITTPEIEISDNSFVMPKGGITVKAVFSRIGSITVKDCENCTVTPSRSLSVSGEKITLRIVPDEGMKFSEWIVSPADIKIENNTFVMPDEDVIVSCVCVPETYEITWNINGRQNKQNVNFREEIKEPDVLKIDGYKFEGWTPAVENVMPAHNLEYTAVFSKIVSYATFVADGKTVAEFPYSVDETFEEPDVPEKPGYIGVWEEYELKTGGVTVNAIYFEKQYKAVFIADGETVKEIPFSVKDEKLTEPVVPEKPGYSAEWSDYTLGNEDLTIEAVYTPISYTAVFKADGESVQTVRFTVENGSINAPAVPEKAGYTAKWENYDIRPENFIVNAVYTPLVYSAKFVADGRTVKIVKYTCEDKVVEEPAIPEKEGYSAEWDMYELEIGGITVNAVYTVNTYNIIWDVDGETAFASVKYGEKIIAPADPVKEGFEFIGWNPAVLETMPAEDLHFEALFGKKKAIADIIVDGVKIGEIEYSEGESNIPNLPSVPEKEGYTGEWEIKETENGLSVEAIYTPKTFTVDIIADGKKIGETIYTYGDTELDLSEYPVPEKEGFSGRWVYTLTANGATVNAEYTPLPDSVQTAIINVASEQEINYRSKVIIKATAKYVPEGGYLVMIVNGKEIKGTNTEVCYEISELKDNVTYSVKIVDENGNVIKDGAGNDLKKEGGKITCNAGFFKKLIAFFRGLFKSLKSVEVKPNL